MINVTKKRKGYALLMTLFVAIFLGGVAISLYALASGIAQLERAVAFREQAFRTAESAFQRGIQEIGHDPTYTGTGQVSRACGEVTCVYAWEVTGTYPTKTIKATGSVLRNGNLAGRRTITATVSFDVSGYQVLSWVEE